MTSDARRDQRRADLRSWLVRYRDSLRWNLPYWPMMVVNVAMWGLLPAQRYFSDADLRGIGVLQEEWKTIRRELDEVLEDREGIPGFQEVDPGQRRLTDDNSWRTFVFRFAGRDCEPNRQRCPETAALLDRVPGIYLAMFSILEPGARIPLHAGAIKGLVRYHLGLVVPTGEGCWIEISGVRHTWAEGESLAFDDTYPHRVRNDTDSVRVVLFLDVERPMPWPWLGRFNRWVLARLTASKRIRTAVERAERAAT